MHKLIFNLLAILVLVGCSTEQLERNTDVENSFNSLVAMVSDNSDSEIQLSAFINFEWDKAFLFTPYTPQEELEQKLNVQFKNASGIDRRDDIFLLVFLHDGKVVQYAELARQHADFSIGELEYLTPANDVILVTR